MQYRPEYHLDRLRMTLDDYSSIARREGEPLLHLRWLRTVVVDLSHTAERDVGERVALLRRSAVGCAVERIVCNELSKEHLLQMLPLVTQCAPLLTSLDLRRCDMDSKTHDLGDILLAVANAHGLSLRRLYLPSNCLVTQSTLDRFTQLEELDVSGCRNLTNVDFCSATLRVLYANDCYDLTDAGLSHAKRLEVLHVAYCAQVTDVSPFAHCLLELDASGYACGIESAALSDCPRLQVLNAYNNDKITTLQSFAQRLRELDAGDSCSALNDAALANATGLVSLSVCENYAITTVGPFGASLRRLDARLSTIDDAGLVTATNLVYLNASFNDSIDSLTPFSASLLELEATGISDAAFSETTNLILLDVSSNQRITTVQSCSRSLRHVVAWGDDCALADEGLSTATQLVTLNCRENRKLATIQPFLHSLEELFTDSESQFLELERALNLHYVEGSVSKRSIAELERNGFIGRQLRDGTIAMHRNTVTYRL